MRKQSIVNSFKMALVALPLLASCDGTVGTAQVLPDPSGYLLPDCQDGQIVGINADKTLTCLSVTSAADTLKPCTGTQVLTGTKNIATGLVEPTCVNVGSGINDVTTQTRISKATTDIANLQQMVTQITTGGGIRSRYVGASTATTNGDILGPNSSRGPRAGNLLCAADYGVNAHICTPFEIYESVVIGDVITGTADLGPLMVYMEAWVPPSSGTGSEPTAGLSENCGGFTYGTAHLVWRNTFFSFAVPTGGTVRVPRFNADARCGTAAKLACCK